MTDIDLILAEQYAKESRERKREGEAGERQRYPLYLRFGDLPVSGRSDTWRQKTLADAERLGIPLSSVPWTQEDLETGISVFRARRISEKKFEVLLKGTGAGSVLHIIRGQDRPVFLVAGEEVGTGSAREPLLVNARTERRLPADTVVEGSGLWESFGASMSQVAAHRLLRNRDR